MNNNSQVSKWAKLFVPLISAALLIGCGKTPSTPSTPPPAPPSVAIHTAVITGDLSAIQQHNAAESNLNEPDATTQSTPLMNAIVFGKKEIAKALIEAGVDLNQKNNDGSTALISAAFFSHPDLVQALLDHGADKNIRNNAGATALSVVEGPWEMMKPIYDMVGGMLAPLGLVLDYERIQSARPKIADMLRNVGNTAQVKKPITTVSTDPDFIVETLAPSGDEQYLNVDSEYIFDQTRLPTFELRIPGSAYAKLDSAPADEEYVEGSLTFEGETISPVKIRYKGSVGAWAGGISGANPFEPSGHKIRTKLSIKIKFNGLGSTNKFYGLNKLQLHSQNLDPSQLRERLGYWLFREMGVPAPRSVHARLVINGKFSGLYALTEQIDGRFTRHHFDEGKGNLYKEVWPLNADGHAQNEAAYISKLKTNEDEDPSVNLIQTFANEIAAASDTDVPEIISRWMNVGEIVSFAAVDRAIRNDDGPFHWYVFGGFTTNHNFYWYEEPTKKQHHLIPWDLDNAFENIISNANPVTPIADAWGKVRASCEPFNYGPFNIQQRSASCDKLTKG
ncbi:MAG: hypothetical protein HOI66_06045, partial [Verrucomicrobia bacterium]|nr:hypothetical protein [Verrucomicrobiota bacterium]